jgi:selenium-binding protein 1
MIRVFKNGLTLDRWFDLDFDTAFATGPARPHGLAMK